MRILVLGAYGLIGSEVARSLRSAGHHLVGLGRSAETGKRLMPEIDWIGADLATLVTPDDWRSHLSGVDAVVNASGALQSGGRDDLVATQDRAVRALIAACEVGGIQRFVQISAPGAARDAKTEFLRTKASADEALRVSRLGWVIFKPGLVISRNAYGGTALLRMLAGFPFVQPLVLADRKMQTVSAEDVADAVRRAIESSVPFNRDFDLVEEGPHTLFEIISTFRSWLELPRPLAQITLPDWIGLFIAEGADVAGGLGWRSPLRTTALKVLSENVVGDPAPWRAVTGKPLASLDETLAAMPSTLQERVFAKTQIVLPLLLTVLGAFWIVSGAVGLWRFEDSVAVLEGTMPQAVARAAVTFGLLVDIAIGIGILIRPVSRWACGTAAAITSVYMIAATIFVPHLWADPLGAMVKALPVLVLSLTGAALLEDR